jgi:serine/threonine-protein phosphatase 2B catalytic subunit
MPGGYRPHGHLRQSSLGTTTTSPSTRRRPIENTISLIREAAEGRGDEDPDLESLADQLSKTSTNYSAWHGRGPSV